LEVILFFRWLIFHFVVQLGCDVVRMWDRHAAGATLLTLLILHLIGWTLLYGLAVPYFHNFMRLFFLKFNKRAARNNELWGLTSCPKVKEINTG